MKAYKQNNYEQALIETYLKFDELLRVDKVNQFLKQNGANRKESRLDVNFAYGLQPEFGTIADEYTKTEENGTVENEKNSGNKTKAISQNAYIPKENIIDLTKESPRSSPANSSEDKTASKEYLTLNSNKIEISLRNSASETSLENYDDLIAKDMGTTACIMLIKNNYLYLANVGDSLAVLFKNGVAVRLNQEHKTTLPSEYTRISKSGSKIINNRIEGRLNLTRALGKFKKNIHLR